MKKPQHILEAERIGLDSYDLINYRQLPHNASRAKQIESLKADKKWQRSHSEDMMQLIEALINDIANSKT